MKILTIGLTTATVGILALASAPVVHAAEVPGEAKDTQTQVHIIDSPAPDPAILKLVHVPEQYNFETQLQATGEYTLLGGVVEKDSKITVFNNKSTQDWSVKASINNTTLRTESGKTATVTNFKINGQDLMGENANQIVSKSAIIKTVDNNTGYLSKEVTNNGLSVSFNNEKGDLKVGDTLTGQVHYQLFDTPDAL